MFFFSSCKICFSICLIKRLQFSQALISNHGFFASSPCSPFDSSEASPSFVFHLTTYAEHLPTTMSSATEAYGDYKLSSSFSSSSKIHKRERKKTTHLLPPPSPTPLPPDLHKPCLLPHAQTNSLHPTQPRQRIRQHVQHPTLGFHQTVCVGMRVAVVGGRSKSVKVVRLVAAVAAAASSAISAAGATARHSPSVDVDAAGFAGSDGVGGRVANCDADAGADAVRAAAQQGPDEVQGGRDSGERGHDVCWGVAEGDGVDFRFGRGGEEGWGEG